MPSKVYTALLLLIFCLPLSASELYDQIEIISSDDQGIRFVLSLDDPEKLYHRLSDQDSLYYLGKQVLIGLPPNSYPIITMTRGSEPLDLSELTPLLVSYGASSAVIDGVRSLRGRWTASLTVYPFTGLAAYSRIEVEVKFVERGSPVATI